MLKVGMFHICKVACISGGANVSFWGGIQYMTLKSYLTGSLAGILCNTINLITKNNNVAKRANSEWIINDKVQQSKNLTIAMLIIGIRVLQHVQIKKSSLTFYYPVDTSTLYFQQQKKRVNCITLKQLLHRQHRHYCHLKWLQTQRRNFSV